MKSRIDHFLLALALGATTSASAEPMFTDYQHPDDAGAVVADAKIDVPDEAQTAVALVDAFGEALASADFELVEEMLDPNVIVLESGGVESSREEYLMHHARSDASFLAQAKATLLGRRARIRSDTAWVASEGELHVQKDGEPLVLLTTETMVLGYTGLKWKITHIHWSSRPKQPAERTDAQ